jgi:hypothetical protein
MSLRVLPTASAGTLLSEPYFATWSPTSFTSTASDG